MEPRLPKLDDLLPVFGRSLAFAPPSLPVVDASNKREASGIAGVPPHVNRKTLGLGALLLVVGCSTQGGFHLNSGAILGERGPAPSPTDYGESPLVMPPIPPKTASSGGDDTTTASQDSKDSTPPAASAASAATAPASTVAAKATSAAKTPPAPKTPPPPKAAPPVKVASAATPAPKPPAQLAVSNTKPASGVTAAQGSDSDSASSSGPSKDGWSTLSAKSAGFHVDMPDGRTEKDDEVDVGDKSAKLHAWFAKAADGSVYTASVIKMAGATDSTLHDVGEGLAEGCGGTVTTEAPTHLGSVTGLRVVIQCKDKASFVARLFRAHGVIFEIGVMRKAGAEPSATAAEELGRFFDSFAILP